MPRSCAPRRFDGFLKQAFRIANDADLRPGECPDRLSRRAGGARGEMTVGMLFAFVSYKQQFVDKAARLVERAIEFRMLDLHLDRLGDIAGAEPEASHFRPAAYQQPIQGNLEVRNLCFRYAEGEPFVLRDVNFTIHAGDYVAITGPSGGGKTTLLKLILGLFGADRRRDPDRWRAIARHWA